MIIDAWGQHPTLRHLQDPMFESLRRWARGAIPTEQVPIGATLAAMQQAQVDLMLISAWYGPRNVMISNDEVAEFVAQSGGKLAGVGSVDISPAANSACRSVRKSATPDP
jgi:predicted TIM-barrel fold metal-dependent hydrolase